MMTAWHDWSIMSNVLKSYGIFDRIGNALRRDPNLVEASEIVSEVSLVKELEGDSVDPQDLLEIAGLLQDEIGSEQSTPITRYVGRLINKIFGLYSFSGQEHWLTADQIARRGAEIRGETKPIVKDADGNPLTGYVGNRYYKDGKLFNKSKGEKQYVAGRAYNGTLVDDDGVKRYYRGGLPFTGERRVHRGIQVFEDGLVIETRKV